MDQAAIAGMPEPVALRLATCDGVTLVTCGRSLLYRYDAADTGMRNLAIVALTDAGRRVDEVAAAFGLSATYVSILRGRARAQGSAGLVRRRGRPPKLSDRQVAKARVWAAEGGSQQSIADRLGVARSVISELLARLGPAPVQAVLPEPADTEQDPTPPVDTDGAGVVPANASQFDASQFDASQFDADGDDASRDDADRADTEPSSSAAGPAGTEPAGAVVGTEPAGAVVGTEPAGAVAELFAGSARIGAGVHRSRYAGAMLLHPFLHRVGAEAIFATLTGGPARRYDDLAVLTCATLGFALGIDTVEGAKHLRRAEAGPVVGLTVIPELATLRARLGALADGGDPLQLQRAFAAGLLTADPAADPVYFVDDHFVPYAGARPVAKGWNTKRRHAQPGRDDTLLVDARGRAVVFDSGEPTGLASTLPGVLTQLRQVLGPDAPILLAFDRGGAYPAAFRACREAGAHWITYRRAPLVASTATPVQASTVFNGRTVTLTLAEETVQLTDYGPARQLTLYEHDTEPSWDRWRVAIRPPHGVRRWC